VAESIDVLQRRIDELRSEVRRAAMSGDRMRARELRVELRRAEDAWEDALANLEADAVRPPAALAPSQRGPLLPLREQVHHVLTLLTVPAAPRLIISVHEAFFSGEMIPARLTSLRRDEQRSYESAPNARPYYLCAALTADLLAPARGLLAVSTWTMADRIVGPLSPRVHYLTAAIQVAERVERLDETVPTARRLLWRFAGNIPGAAEGGVAPEGVAKAARAELVIHEEDDLADREAAAERAARMEPLNQLFGSTLRVIRKRTAG
jgi:hypothetical protein